MMNAPDDLHAGQSRQSRTSSRSSKLAELVLELTGSKSPLERQPLPADDPTQPPPGHHAGPREARLAADGPTARRAGQDDRLVSDDRSHSLSGTDTELLGLSVVCCQSSVAF